MSRSGRLLVSAAVAAGVLLSGPAWSHSGGQDSNGGHYCREAGYNAGTCSPLGSYHCHQPGCTGPPAPAPEDGGSSGGGSGGESSGLGAPASHYTFNDDGTFAYTGAPAPAPRPVARRAAARSRDQLPVTGYDAVTTGMLGGTFVQLGWGLLLLKRRLLDGKAPKRVPAPHEAWY